MKIVIPWICVFALTVGCLFLYSTTKEDEKELVRLRAESEELVRLRAESEELKKLKVEHDELVRLRNDNEELLRLRNEVGQLRKQSKQLVAQLQAAQAQSSVAIQKEQQATQLSTENQALRSQFQQLQQAQAQAQAATCINNLRRIEDTKQLWAQENKKPQGTVPTAAELGGYFTNNTFVTCPAGGTYTINPLGMAPTCSVPGHALPKP